MNTNKKTGVYGISLIIGCLDFDIRNSPKADGYCAAINQPIALQQELTAKIIADSSNSIICNLKLVICR
ncbi:hypothetical protein [Nostoc sp. DSM 114160]